MENKPKLLRKYRGEIIYATPGSGKTFLSQRYENVVDTDVLKIEAIKEIYKGIRREYPGFDFSQDDVIYRFHVHVNGGEIMKKVTKMTIKKMRGFASRNYIVLTGQKDLLHIVDRVFVQRNASLLLPGFNPAKERKMIRENYTGSSMYEIYSYLGDHMVPTPRLAKSNVNRCRHDESHTGEVSVKVLEGEKQKLRIKELEEVLKLPEMKIAESIILASTALSSTNNRSPAVLVAPPRIYRELKLLDINPKEYAVYGSSTLDVKDRISMIPGRRTDSALPTPEGRYFAWIFPKEHKGLMDGIAGYSLVPTLWPLDNFGLTLLDINETHYAVYGKRTFSVHDTIKKMIPGCKYEKFHPTPSEGEQSAWIIPKFYKFVIDEIVGLSLVPTPFHSLAPAPAYAYAYYGNAWVGM
jgi:hypothetical protein